MQAPAAALGQSHLLQRQLPQRWGGVGLQGTHGVMHETT